MEKTKTIIDIICTDNNNDEDDVDDDYVTIMIILVRSWFYRLITVTSEAKSRC